MGGAALSCSAGVQSAARDGQLAHPDSDLEHAGGRISLTWEAIKRYEVSDGPRCTGCSIRLKPTTAAVSRGTSTASSCSAGRWPPRPGGAPPAGLASFVRQDTRRRQGTGSSPSYRAAARLSCSARGHPEPLRRTLQVAALVADRDLDRRVCRGVGDFPQSWSRAPAPSGCSARSHRRASRIPARCPRSSSAISPSVIGPRPTCRWLMQVTRCRRSPYIAAVVPPGQEGEYRLVEQALLRPGPELAEEVAGQRRMSSRRSLSRGRSTRQAVDAVVEVAPDRPAACSASRSLLVAQTRRKPRRVPDIAADALVRSLLGDAQQLGLQGQRRARLPRRGTACLRRPAAKAPVPAVDPLR